MQKIITQRDVENHPNLKKYLGESLDVKEFSKIAYGVPTVSSEKTPEEKTEETTEEVKKTKKKK